MGAEVVMTTVYLTDLNEFSRFKRVFAEYFGEIRPQGHGAGCPSAQEALVEISAIAQDQIAF